MKFYFLNASTVLDKHEKHLPEGESIFCKEGLGEVDKNEQVPSSITHGL